MDKSDIKALTVEIILKFTPLHCVLLNLKSAHFHILVFEFAVFQSQEVQEQRTTWF